VTALVHGVDEAMRAETANASLFSSSTLAEGSDPVKAADNLLAIADEVPSTTIAAAEFEGNGMNVVDLVARVTAASKSEARRLVLQGAVSVNDRKIVDATARLMRTDALDGRVFLMRRGARQRFVIRLT
jgi:tyrosyl-tRNA synthetase